MNKLLALVSLVTLVPMSAFAESSPRECTGEAGVVAEKLAATKAPCELEVLPPELSFYEDGRIEMNFQYSCGYIMVPVSTKGASCAVVGPAHF